LISLAGWAILPALVTRTLAAILLIAAFAGAGCATPCEELAKRICACVPAGTERDACNRAARDAVNSPEKAGAEQQDFCDSKLSTCPDAASDSAACDRLKTCEGKVACGLSAPGACDQLPK
jgi:hypothetical protein